MICSDCGNDGDKCTCDVHHYVKTGEKRNKPTFEIMERLNREVAEWLGTWYSTQVRPNYIIHPEQLLRELVKREDWSWEGIPEHGGISNLVGMWKFTGVGCGSLKHFVNSDYITDQTGLLVTKVWGWMKERENER